MSKMKISSVNNQLYELLHTTNWSFERIAAYVGCSVEWVESAWDEYTRDDYVPDYLTGSKE